MRIPLSLRASRACALATLVFSLHLEPSYARMGGSIGHSAFGGGHFPHFTPGGPNRRFGRSGFNRFGPNRFDRFGWNPLFFGGGWGWGAGFPVTAASETLILGDSAPVIINVSLDPGAADAGAAHSGGCVLHPLNYDSSGKYVGERQISHC